MSKISFIRSLAVKSTVYASILALALSLLSFPAQQSAFASMSETSAQGSLQYSLAEGFTRSLEFNAITNGDGTATGRMTVSGPIEFADQDMDGTGRAGFSGRLENLQIEAEFNGMRIERNRAVMSGTVTGSTLGDYIGQRVLLVVEDNGEGIERGDKFTLGFYKPEEEGWIPTDAELREDDGWRLTWTATDAERRDDEGVEIRREWVLDCHSFPLSSYDFTEVRDGEGDIRVQP